MIAPTPIQPETVAGPYFEDLEVGMKAPAAPGLTLTEGHAALHQAILGDRLRLALDAPLSAAVLGPGPPLAHPGLVWDVAIGQSTLLTQRVVANLFYRGLVLHRAPRIGDTLRTEVEVVGLRQNSPREGRPATGLAALRVRTTDQEERLVLDFWRCAMLPLGDPELQTGRADDLTAIGAESAAGDLGAWLDGWDLGVYRDAVAGPHFADLDPGASWRLDSGDLVAGATELARLSLNVASAHHDAASTSSGQRLVYGGHTIGLVCSQVVRCLPSLLTVVGWRSCDHVGPVLEGDTVRTELELERTEPLAAGGGLAHLRARGWARRGEDEHEVLDWHLIGALA
ncbi:MAG TPA: MaoC family dehydratase [Solirubrobacterales bacterium]|nr:MaoC family dehydratase [Solirubrobacterales bacterium]